MALDYNLGDYQIGGTQSYSPVNNLNLSGSSGATSSGSSGYNYFGDIVSGIGTLGGVLGGFFGGMGNDYQQQMMNQINLAQANIQQDYLVLAQREFERQLEIIEGFRDKFGANYEAMLGWAFDMDARLKGIGKYEGMSLEQSLNDSTAYDVVERGLSTIKQAGTSQIEMGRERLGESLASRGIAKESGLGASTIGKYEEDVTNQLSQKTMEYEQEALNNLQQQATQTMAFAAVNKDAFSGSEGDIYGPTPPPSEATRLPESGPRVPGSPMDSYLTPIGSRTNDPDTGWLYDNRTGQYFFVKDGAIMGPNWADPNGSGVTLAEQAANWNVTYGVPPDAQEMMPEGTFQAWGSGFDMYNHPVHGGETYDVNNPPAPPAQGTPAYDAIQRAMEELNNTNFISPTVGGTNADRLTNPDTKRMVVPTPAVQTNNLSPFAVAASRPNPIKNIFSNWLRR